MIRAILFDLDGVVIDSEPLYEAVEKQLFEQYGISMPEGDQKIFKGTTEIRFYDLVEEMYHPDWDRQQVMREGRKLLLDLFARELRFVPGFLSLMDRLHGRYLTGLVTSTPRYLLEEVRDLLPVETYFPEMICADDISAGKPHPEPYLTMMKRLSVSPAETVVIEDSLHGITSATASGAVCVALATSFSREELQQADKVVGSLDEIDEGFVDALSEQRSPPDPNGPGES
ncbi:MAG: HAD family hydrolase [Fidelibacterota bacterium]